MVIFDNGGETLDRYTIVTIFGDMYGCSDQPYSPLGFAQYVGDAPDDLSHLGKVVELESLNPDVQKYVNYLGSY